MILIAALLAACSSAAAVVPTLPATGPTPTVTVPAGMPVVVTLGGPFRGPELAALDEMIAAFEAANPDIWVEVADIRGNSERQRERIADELDTGAGAIDVYVVDNPWLAGLTAEGWLVPLDDYLESEGIDPAGFLPPAVQEVEIDGQLVALPWTVDAGVLYYRADLLDRYGRTPPADWAGVQELALDLKARADLPYGYVWQGAAYGSLTCNTLEFVWAHGGSVLDASGKATFDSPQTRQALSQMRDLIASGASPEDVITYNEAKSESAFQAGNAAFMRHWASQWTMLSGADSSVAGQVGVAPLPASCLIGQSLALSASSQSPKEAFRLMAFLVGYEQQVRWAQATGLLPALSTAYHADPGLEPLATLLAAARPLPKTPSYLDISQAIYEQTHELLAGSQDVGTTASTIQRSIEDALTAP